MSTEYKEPVGPYGDRYSVAGFRSMCNQRVLTDYDGFGHPAKGGLMAETTVKPSNLKTIPDDATEIIWFNR